MQKRTHTLKILALSVMTLPLFALSSCSSVETEAKYPSGLERTSTGDDIYGEKESIFGKDGLALFGGGKKDSQDGGSGIGVNSFLWRASLDTVSFMPLASADPFGGVILTDWYSAAEAPNERFKLNVFILGRQLRSDGIRVRAFKQELVKGKWRDAKVTDETARKLEDTILTRARQLRVANIEN